MNAYIKRRRVFRVLSIVFGVLSVCSLLLAILIVGKIKNIENSSTDNTTLENEVYSTSFCRGKYIDLGMKEDGYYYVIVYSMMTLTPEREANFDDGEYVVLKSKKDKPVVEYYIAPEGTSPNTYSFKQDVEIAPMSDYVTPEVMEEYPGAFDELVDGNILVVDFDKDITYTPQDRRNDFTDGIFELAIVGILAMVSVVMNVITALLIIAFIVFLILFLVNNKKARLL